MNTEAVQWVLGGFAIIVGVFIWGMTCFWKSWSGLNLYFEEMKSLPEDRLKAMGWMVRNPIKMYHVGALQTPHNGLTFKRLIARLYFYGRPMHLAHSPTAIKALKQFRIWTTLGALSPLTFVIVVSANFGTVGLGLALPFLIGLIVSFAIAVPWPKESL